MAITSAMNSLEQSVEKMREHLTHAESRINQAEEGSTRTTHLVGYLFWCKRQLEERCEDLENYTRRNNLQIYGVAENSESGDSWCSGLRHFWGSYWIYRRLPPFSWNESTGPSSRDRLMKTPRLGRSLWDLSTTNISSRCWLRLRAWKICNTRGKGSIWITTIHRP